MRNDNDVQATNYQQPCLLSPYHGLVLDKDVQTRIGTDDRIRVARLIKSMRRHGWQGRPLLAVDDSLLTGTCRLQAAIQLGLEHVPVYRIEVMTTEHWDQIAGVDEYEDLADLLRELGYPEAAALMDDEYAA